MVAVAVAAAVGRVGGGADARVRAAVSVRRAAGVHAVRRAVLAAAGRGGAAAAAVGGRGRGGGGGAGVRARAGAAGGRPGRSRRRTGRGWS